MTAPTAAASCARRLAATFAATVTLLAGALSSAVPASAATSVGPVDLQRACNDQYGAHFGYVARPLDRHDAFSWRCIQSWQNHKTIDVNRACATQYGHGAWSGLRNRSDAYSWYCQR